MRIATYNVNGIRAAMKKNLLGWLAQEKPDIFCIQELKANESQIAVNEFEALGYQCYWCCAEKKGYSGVGILTLEKPYNVVYGIGDDFFDKEGRLLRADFEKITVVSVYLPNGYARIERKNYKRQWMAYFYAYAYRLLEKCDYVVISGDFNTCCDLKDIHEAALKEKNNNFFLLEERQWMKAFVSNGFIDSFRYMNPETEEFTWWSMRTKARERNHGWRIDYHMVSPLLQKQIKNAWIQQETQHSDHCPAWLDLEYP